VNTPDPDFASGADTLIHVLREAAADGYDASFQAVTDSDDETDTDATTPGLATCSECDTTSEATAFDIEHFRRLEGASDAADLMLVAFTACPSCGAKGTVTLGYGPNAGRADDRFLAALDLRDASTAPEG
jgi:hypothetical protein